MQNGIISQQEQVYRLEKTIARKSYEISRSSWTERKETTADSPSLAERFICFFLV
jgi:hypothetical protein